MSVKSIPLTLQAYSLVSRLRTLRYIRNVAEVDLLLSIFLKTGLGAVVTSGKNLPISFAQQIVKFMVSHPISIILMSPCWVNNQAFLRKICTIHVGEEDKANGFERVN